MSLTRRILSVLSSKIATLVISLFVHPVLVRILGSGPFGDYAFVMSIFGIAMIVTNAGLFDGIRKYIAEDRSEDNWSENVFNFYTRIGLLLAFVAAVLIITGSFYLSGRLLPAQFEYYFYLLAGMVIGQQALSISRASLMGLGLESKSEPIAILNRILFLSSAATLAYVGFGVSGVLLGHIFSIVIATLFNIYFLSKIIPLGSIRRSIPSSFPSSNLIKFNFYSVLLLLLMASLYHTDILLLRTLIGSSQTGYYKAALLLAEFLWFVPNALRMVLLQSSSELWSNNQSERVSTIASFTTKLNFWSTLLLTVGLFVLARDFVPLYFGNDFQPSIRPLLLLLPGVLGFALARPIISIGQGRGRLRVLISSTFVAALLNLILNSLLIPLYGMQGAAVATSTSYGLMFFLHLWGARKIGFNPVQDLEPIKIGLVGVLTLGCLLAISNITDSRLISLVIVPPIGFLIYSALSLKFNIFSRSEIQVVINQLPQRWQEMAEKLVS